MKRAVIILSVIFLSLIITSGWAIEVTPGAGVGLKIGSTTCDEQHPARMARQIAWRQTHNIHMIWHKRAITDYSFDYEMTTCQAWNASYGELNYSPETDLGGRDLHGYYELSKYPGIDVMSDGRAIVCNIWDPDGISPYIYKATIWPENYPMTGYFGYKTRIPEELLEDSPCYDYTAYFHWPYISFQLYDNGYAEDTIIHILSKENCLRVGFDEDYPTELRYFRRLGGPHPESPALHWDDYMIVDTTFTTGYCVEAAGYEAQMYNPGKVAIAWIAHWPNTTGENESTTPDAFTSVKEQNCNDIYIMVSEYGGETWSDKYNITKNDSLTGGWAPLSDISAVIDADGYLHVVYAARQYINTDEGSPQLPDDMDWPYFPMASRILHWSDMGESVGPALDDNFITVVKDMHFNWDDYPDCCPGGKWSWMSLAKPMISQCDNKLYVLYNQYQDPQNGIYENCHISRYTGEYYYGAANATLHLAVSDNAGLNWDPSRALTDFTLRCDTGQTSSPEMPVDPEAWTVCHNHGWPSMARWGMHVEYTDDFDDAVIVNDVSWSQSESPDFYLDVLYVDDLYPGNIIQGEGAWTINPVKWFRIPCVDAIPGATLAPSQYEIYEPDFQGGPGEEIIYTVTLENHGNVPLDIIITTEEIDNEHPSFDGWLYVDLNGFGGTLSEVVPNNTHDIYVIVNHGGVVDVPYVPTTLNGRVIFDYDGRAGQTAIEIEHLIPEPAWICGDFDGNEGINILDIVYLINYIYKGGPEPIPLEAAEVDGQPGMNILDIVYLINYIYKGGPDPDCP